MMAGITVLPARSIRVAPAGAVISPRRAMRVIVPRSARMAVFSTAALPSPAIRRAPSNNTVWAVAGCAKAAAASVTSPNQAAVWDIDLPSPSNSLHFDAHCAPGAPACQSTGLLALDVQRSDHLRIFVGLAAQVGSKLGAAARVRIERLDGKLGPDVRRLNSATEGTHELHHHRGWCLRRRDQAEPDLRVETRKTGFRDGG